MTQTTVPAVASSQDPRTPGRKSLSVVHDFSPVARAVLYFFVAFLLVFPKGGIRIGAVPVTWGYLGLAPFFVWFALRVWGGSTTRILPARLIVLAFLIPFQIMGWAGLLFYGAADLGYAISLAVTFFFVPTMFVLAFGPALDRYELGPVLKALKAGILVISVYGILLFFFRLATGRFLEIPYLTVNAGDVGSLDLKNIDRGGIFKLISTYNNGNVYGISVLILLPLYSWLEESRVKRGLVKFSLLLTLSRTVWAGLLCYEIVHRVLERRISARMVAGLVMALSVMLAGVWYLVGVLDRDIGFLFDRSLGGRITQLDALRTATFLPTEEFSVIQEMVYLSVMDSYGILGLAVFLVGMTAPLVLFFGRYLPFARTSYKRSLATGLLVYLVVAISDGAILLIPVMAFYWFVVSLLISDNPSFADFKDSHISDGAPPTFRPSA